MRCIELTGSDNRMDCGGTFDKPLNPLPPRCDVCGFPDLDYVPQPYYLLRSRSMTPNEMAPAENGNFFVRDRIRRVLELLSQKDFSFHPTCYKGTTEHTPWYLVVPTNQVVTARVDPSILRCDACGEPSSAHPGTQYAEWIWNKDSRYEAVKSSTWGSSELGWDKWISRHLYMSVRLFALLTEIKAKGLDEATCGKTTSSDREEKRWLQEQLDLLAERTIPLHAPGTIADIDAKWFRQYLKDHQTQVASSIDWRSLEKSSKFKVPKSYKDFMGKVGPSSFHDVDDQEGLIVHVLPPTELDVTSYRAGALEADDAESNVVDGVMFAKTDHGDCLCFDVQKNQKEFEVFLYLHELDCFEPYATNFATCIQRFVAGKE